MPISTSWLYDKRVIIQKHQGTTTGKQLTESIAELQAMIRQGQAPVHVFIDASQSAGQSEIGLGDLKSLIPKVIEGTGWIIAVQPSTVQRFFTSLGMQLAGAKYKFVKDQREGMQYLLEHDPTLRDVIR